MNTPFRMILAVGFVFTILWLVGVVLMFCAFVWGLFIADPALMAPDSLNRDSPVEQKVFALGLLVFFIGFGIGWLALIRYLWRRIES